MKKLIPLCLIGIVVLSGLGAVAQSGTENTLVTETVRFSEPALKTANNYFSVSLHEANSFLMNHDKPLLPSFSETYTFPFGTIIHDVTVTPQNIQTQTLTKDIEPTPQAVAISQTTAASKDNLIDYGLEPYPSRWFDYRVGCGLYNGEIQIIVKVDIYPIQYQPQGKVLQWASQADILIQYSTSSPPQSSARDDYRFVVIGPASYSSQVAPLITHKINRGVTSRFVSLEDIYAGTHFPATGRDNQEKIKYFVKNALETWLTSNILLVGGSSQLPVRETHVYLDGDDPDDEVFSSDLYYADIYNKTGGFCSWDSNNNNIFGEYDWFDQYDEVDLHPDVNLARIPATSGSQVTACVNKFMGYENTPGYQQDWFTNLLVVGGDSFQDNGAI
ncbi:MAG: hypothetical protein JXA75_03120, partial [Candidatus Thermoplasmatota archaeon]|nr:hypothetical protein [Candidatus Thermoplasmatota archaeon]